jgi:AraC family transcriptional regulator of adaptative response/methylated-DNA-[protein]-cysteine methyltransferase
MTTAQLRVARACAAMNIAGGPVALSDLASEASVRQLQRDFMDVVGISPRQYGQAVRADQARRSLMQQDSVLDAVFASGYGSVRAFYEGAARRLGMSPTEYRAGAPGQVLLWSAVASALGWVVAAVTERGVAAVRIGDVAAMVDEVSREFPYAVLERDDDAMADVMRALAALAAGQSADRLPLDVRGTAFQARVWAALREIPAGQTRTYTQVAEQIGDPSAVRAVARACATNPAALTVPCHRVIRGDGSLAGYRWGLAVKATLVESERQVQ